MNKFTSTPVSLIVLIAIAVGSAFSQTSSFSYQGEFSNAGSPANGPYDMEFRLFDAAAAGTQIGATVTRNAVNVTDGIFGVILDFGSTAFPGADRYVEISVRPQGGQFSTLSPRSQMLSSPYAVRAKTVTGPINGTSASATLSVTNDQPGITDPSPQNLPPAAVKGEATSTSNSNIGVLGIGNGSTGIGVVGVTNGVGAPKGADAIGVLGLSTSSTGETIGVSAQVSSPNGTAIDASAPPGGYLFYGSDENSTAFTVSASGEVMASGPLTSHGFTSDGNATIGGTLGVVSTLTIGNIPSGGNTPLCALATSGGLIRFCSSSMRYKEHARPFTAGLSLIDQLKPIVFDWKENGAIDVGLAAEDVAAIEPLLTFNNEKGEVEGVKYAQLSVVFVNAIREQQAQIGRQQAQIDKLTKLVRQMTAGKRSKKRTGAGRR